MKLNNTERKLMITASLVLMTAVMLGAFGAHGLKAMLTEPAMATFKTGITYHYYHGLALFLCAILSVITQKSFKLPYGMFLCGILLFSVNCYLYAVTQIKVIAMIIPVGGLLFITGWLTMAYKLYQLKSENE